MIRSLNDRGAHHVVGGGGGIRQKCVAAVEMVQLSTYRRRR
jgi:hypothetical protein